MTDSDSHNPNRPTDDPDPSDGDDSPPPTPRWVIAFGIFAIVLILAFLISHLSDGGFRGHSMP